MTTEVFSGSLFVNPAFRAFFISSCLSRPAASAFSTHFLAPAVSPSTQFSINLCLSSVLKKCVSHCFSAARFFLDLKLCNAPGLRLLLPPSCACLHLLDDIVGWTTMSIYRICLLEVVKRSFSKLGPLLSVLKLLFGEMVHVATYGQYGGKLRLLCQGWYVH
jgi:hypothetical protein